MNHRWQPFAQDSVKNIAIIWHPTATPLQMVEGTHADGVDISAFVTRASHSAAEGNVTVTWHLELYEVDQPQPGQIIEFRLDDQLLWWGVIESLNGYRLSSGVRSLTLTLRSRDASPHWRNVRRVTEIYPVATPLSVIARDIAYTLGLSDAEIGFGETSVTTVHSNTQLADLTAWEMLEKLAEPLGVQSFVDARGVLKTISRDITRPVDIVLTTERIISVTAAKSRPPLTAVKVRWLDPNLTKVSQQDQLLASINITAGFFQLKQKKRIAFSEDETQRAENTYLVIRQSANSGLLPVCEESYSQETQTGGEIVLTTYAWVPALVTAGMAAILSSSLIPDGVTPTETIPLGRPIQAGAEITVLLTLASIGTGMYEIWGTPYDYVHARNITEAYDQNAPEWLSNEVEIENDFIMDEPMAQAYAVRELLYRAREVSSFNMSIVDDPRIEPGDIIELPDQSRLYVTNYQRDVSPGSAAVLDVEGFRV
ncbi:hypothetical protein [Nitrosomonas communis]|uniref:Uncharacterized protein n=1 Tax=Nitrosomonas communis TaxID=44574 RepID=A0A1I4LR66_9PROT|nr:hypothetical protein [Nitrosomonas communis]SFL93504.1 hypothetical protein SAMN05421863_100758 [Nitrosomonas communis]